MIFIPSYFKISPFFILSMISSGIEIILISSGVVLSDPQVFSDRTIDD